MKNNWMKQSLLLVFSLILCLGCLGGCTTAETEDDGFTAQESESAAQTAEQSETQENPADAKSVLIKDTGVDSLDFIVQIPEGRAPKILQITDTQMIRLAGARAQRYNPIKSVFFGSDSGEAHDDNIRTWRYVEEGIQRAQPDLIVLTGDNIYGETDDSGALWTDFCNKMDSYGIPWAVIWGNHDNESQKGVVWQNAQVENTTWGMIKQNNTDKVGGKGGNCNYTVGIKQGEEITYLLYMMDTNGARVKTGGESLLATNPDIEIINQTDGLHDTQIAWIENSYASLSSTYGEIPTMWFMHIPPQEALTAWKKAYPTEPAINPSRANPFDATKGDDMGQALEKMCYFQTDNQLLPVMKATNCTNVFFGHDHVNSASVLSSDGIRFTYGLKTGTYDYHDYTSAMLGTTMITVQDSGVSVEHLYSQLAYKEVPGPGK